MSLSGVSRMPGAVPGGGAAVPAATPNPTSVPDLFRQQGHSLPSGLGTAVLGNRLLTAYDILVPIGGQATRANPVPGPETACWSRWNNHSAPDDYEVDCDLRRCDSG